MFAQPQVNCAAKFLWDRQNAEKISLWQLADMSVLAAMEVAGRHVVSRLPGRVPNKSERLGSGPEEAMPWSD